RSVFNRHRIGSIYASRKCEAGGPCATIVVIPVGPWRSWERASMASRRSWVRIPSAPPSSSFAFYSASSAKQPYSARKSLIPQRLFLLEVYSKAMRISHRIALTATLLFMIPGFLAEAQEPGPMGPPAGYTPPPSAAPSTAARQSQGQVIRGSEEEGPI